MTFDRSASKAFKTTARLIAENKWLKNLQTPFPLGLNDNIYKEGNISRNPTIDIFSICSIRKRKSRSHGKRKNGNIKRKNRLYLNVKDFDIIKKQSGKHTMLSRLSALPLSSLVKLDKEADDIYIRSNPLYDTATLIQSYTQHVIRPHLDKEEDHKRHFLKLLYINKGIDFVDLPSIFRDKNVINSIPDYFKNTESPIICYKYKKPTRNIIFNYNKIVSDLDVITNTPISCDCNNSQYRYAPAGHVITGNFGIVSKALRNLFSKGPKYRFPGKIDFNKCRTEILLSLDEFCSKWCKREKADSDSLSLWKKSIITLMEQRIRFYESNPSLLPPRPKSSFRHLKSELQNFHNKFVLVPADKAANNIIII